MKIEIIKCTKCILHISDEWDFYCSHPNSANLEKFYKTNKRIDFPDDCPLKKESLTIYINNIGAKNETI